MFDFHFKKLLPYSTRESYKSYQKEKMLEKNSKLLILFIEELNNLKKIKHLNLIIKKLYLSHFHLFVYQETFLVTKLDPQKKSI